MTKYRVPRARMYSNSVNALEQLVVRFDVLLGTVDVVVRSKVNRQSWPSITCVCRQCNDCKRRVETYALTRLKELCNVSLGLYLGVRIAVFGRAYRLHALA